MRERLSTSSPATKVLGACSLLALATTAVIGLWTSPPDVIQGDAVRPLYVHVPAIWVAYLAFIVSAVCSVLWLVPRTRDVKWDRLAGASAEIGVVFSGINLVSGMLWGRITWGVYWQWDARLTSALLLFVLFVGYLAIRRTTIEPTRRAKRAAVMALVASANIPIVHFSVVWWRTLHQEASVARFDLDFEIEGEMLAALYFGLLAFTLTYGWAVVHRYRLAVLEDEAEERAVAAAIERRRADLVGGGV
ncbi:MAG: cytochrome c biogenesis protein CcsA [Actinomycetota bacterium]